MIYTTCEMINGRAGRKWPNPRPAGENVERGDLSKDAEWGIKWAAIGHHMPHFGCRYGGDRAARNACFLGELRAAATIRPRNSSGDINESAEI